MSEELHRAADAVDVKEGALLTVLVAGRSVLLTRLKGRVLAVSNYCPHMGMPMSKGTVEEGILRCPWHGSRFDVCTGKNLDWVNAFLGVSMPKWTHKLIAMGKSPAGLESLQAEERDGAVFVSAPTVGRVRE